MLNTGEVEITLDGRSEVLRSTLRAARAVNGIGGFSEAFRRLAAFDLEAYVAIVAAGLSKRTQEVEEAVYKTGLPTLTEPLAEFVGLLANGGKPAATGTKEPKAGEV